MSSQLPIAVSIGEPAGIGSDVLAQMSADALADGRALPNHVVLADPDHLEQRIDGLKLPVKLLVLKQSELTTYSYQAGTIGVLPLQNSFLAGPGQPHKDDAKGVVEAITRGVSLVEQGQARALLTLPINKKSLYDSGFDYPGHTEFLGALAQEWPDQNQPIMPVMMLAGPELRAVPVTIHIPLMEVSAALTVDLIVKTIEITAEDLRKRFGIHSPRIAVSGLNPHAGENGAMGKEDNDIVSPAIEILKSRGIDCFGPLPADTMFHAKARQQYDAAVCMYHDQALIPAKALAFDESVNVTLGLPFVRTSPDHGTAYDIAGTGKANPASTLAALIMADRMSKGSANS